MLVTYNAIDDTSGAGLFVLPWISFDLREGDVFNRDGVDYKIENLKLNMTSIAGIPGQDEDTYVNIYCDVTVSLVP